MVGLFSRQNKHSRTNHKFPECLEGSGMLASCQTIHHETRSVDPQRASSVTVATKHVCPPVQSAHCHSCFVVFKTSFSQPGGLCESFLSNIFVFNSGGTGRKRIRRPWGDFNFHMKHVCECGATFPDCMIFFSGV